MRVLICGDSHWVDYLKIYNALRLLCSQTNITVLIDGCALGLTELRFPADWNEYPKAAGMIRSQQILDERKPDLVLAFHSDLAKSKWTRDMVDRARKAGVKVRIIQWPLTKETERDNNVSTPLQQLRR